MKSDGAGGIGRRRRIARAAAGAVVGALFGAALVNAHGGDTARIHACKSASDMGTLYVTDAGDACSGNPDLSPVDWNIPGATGAEGAQGPAGAAGATGPTGRDGPAGIPSDVPLRIQMETSGRPTSTYVHDVTAKCRSGEHVVSGGYSELTSDDEHRLMLRTHLVNNRPLPNGTGWRAVVRRDPAATIDIPWALGVFAACTPQAATP